MKKIRVAINGFGRIGRAFAKVAKNRPEIEIVAINDLGNLENLVYLFKYDTAYGKTSFNVSAGAGNESHLIIDGNKVAFLSEKDPANLPWKDLDVDVVVESTGFFASYEKSKVHLGAGAKRVVVSAPVKDIPEDCGISGATVLMGINDSELKTCDISSNASCTTNAGGPILSILNEGIGIEKAILNTVHGYTATQRIVDGPSGKDFRKGRAGAQNIIPSSTGSAIATTKAMPELDGKFDGVATRVPVITGSIADITFISKKNVTVEEVNEVLKKAAQDEGWQKVFSVTDEPLVSSDIIGSPFASIADLNMTRVVDGNLVKVLTWYDNEMGYSYTLVDHVIKTGGYLK